MGLYVMLFTDAINLEMKEQLKKKRSQEAVVCWGDRISVVNGTEVKSNGSELDFRVCVRLVSDLEQLTSLSISFLVCNTGIVMGPA